MGREGHSEIGRVFGWSPRIYIYIYVYTYLYIYIYIYIYIYVGGERTVKRVKHCEQHVDGAGEVVKAKPASDAHLAADKMGRLIG